MKLLRFDPQLCTLCGACIDKCPFGAITMEKTGITLNENCRMCGVCVRQCQSKALYFEQKAGGEDKSTWNGILVYAEQERGKMHPVVWQRRLAIRFMRLWWELPELRRTRRSFCPTA